MLLKVLILLGAARVIPIHNLSRHLSRTRQFHHHVIIRAKENGVTINCGGTIIKSDWILTSKKCINYQNIDVEFQELNPYSKYQYSIVLKNPEIYQYPTSFDDIALLKLPIDVVFNDDINVAIYWQYEDLYNQVLGIMPGIDNSSIFESLTYGLYKIIDGDKCEEKYGLNFDSNSQICVTDWPYIENKVSCRQASGSGLLVDWPWKSIIIGIFTLPNECYADEPFIGVFTDVGKYSSWIAAVINSTSINDKSVSLISRIDYVY